MLHPECASQSEQTTICLNKVSSAKSLHGPTALPPPEIECGYFLPFDLYFLFVFRVHRLENTFVKYFLCKFVVDARGEGWAVVGVTVWAHHALFDTSLGIQ